MYFEGLKSMPEKQIKPNSYINIIYKYLKLNFNFKVLI